MIVLSARSLSPGRCGVGGFADGTFGIINTLNNYMHHIISYRSQQPQHADHLGSGYQYVLVVGRFCWGAQTTRSSAICWPCLGEGMMTRTRAEKVHRTSACVSSAFLQQTTATLTMFGYVYLLLPNLPRSGTDKLASELR